jgi:hypothetical protein
VAGTACTCSSSSSSCSTPSADPYNVSPVEVVFWASTPLRLRENPEQGTHVTGLQVFSYDETCDEGRSAFVGSESQKRSSCLESKIKLALQKRSRVVQISPGYKFDEVSTLV